MKSGIYSIRNKTTGKYYIGSSKNYKFRLYNHRKKLKQGKHANEYLQNAFNKYGLDDFEFEVLEEYTEELLCAMECYWCNILKVHNRDFGYNIKPILPYSSHKLANETKDKIRNKHLGKKYEFKHKSEEHKKKIGIANKNRKHSEDFKKMRSEFGKLLVGEKNPFYGKKHTKNQINNDILRKSKTILQYDLDDNFIKEWMSATEAAKALGFHQSSINKVCLNKAKSAHNFKWVYK